MQQYTLATGAEIPRLSSRYSHLMSFDMDFGNVKWMPDAN
jgi:hypothetical protein